MSERVTTAAGTIWRGSSGGVGFTTEEGLAGGGVGTSEIRGCGPGVAVCATLDFSWVASPRRSQAIQPNPATRTRDAARAIQRIAGREKAARWGKGLTFPVPVSASGLAAKAFK